MRLVNRAENWERVYEAFQQVNFSAWDFNTIKESLLDYLKLYYPEEFNDYIESSDMIMVLEVFAYATELLAYRFDMNAHENFITLAERKESILRLAKLLSYTSQRNLPARGLVKVQTISTTERLFDARGLDLSNRTIKWNDSNNIYWKEQFLLVLNNVLEQNVGTVLPSDRVQVQDVLFELYSFNNEPLSNNVISLSAAINDVNYPIELVSCLLNAYGPYEKRPEKNQKLNIVYLNDGLGDSSNNTGFFMMLKQGTLSKTQFVYDGVTPNQTSDVKVNDINETDVWLNNIDPITGLIIESTLEDDGVRIGEWDRVDLANAQNVIFNTNPNRNKYEIETLANDQIRLIFGDGNFANVPSGTFDLWYRTSANAEYVIPASAIQNAAASISYRDALRKEHTLSLTVSLIDTIQNASPSEDIDHIRKIAPSVYYTQDRMVNGVDYNEYPLKDNSILKLRTINRTFAGDSKYIYWHDPREYYENVKIFGDDLVVYFNSYTEVINVASSELPPDDEDENEPLISALIDNFIQAQLEKEPYFIRGILSELAPLAIRKIFNDSERAILETYVLQAINNTPSSFYLTLDTELNTWEFATVEPTTWWISVESLTDDGWKITVNGNKLIVHSDDTKFWISNPNTNVITYDTYNSRYDTITILKANVGTTGCALSQNYDYRVLRQEINTAGEDIGLDSIHDLHVLPEDTNDDGLPDDPILSYLIDPETDFVYFTRVDTSSEWTFIAQTDDVVEVYTSDLLRDEENRLYKREVGREQLNFLWMHRTPRYHLIDPAASNIMDAFIITRGYYTNIKQWLDDSMSAEPAPPTPYQLKGDYGYLLDNKMISDTVILHPGKIKPIIGKHAKDELKATIKIIRSSNRSLTNNQIKTIVVDAVLKFFSIEKWEFGETFYFTELAAHIHNVLPVDVDSVVLVPSYSTHVFGDLYQVFSKEDEIIQPSISVNDIEIIESLNPRNLKQVL